MSSAQTGRITFQRPCPARSAMRPSAWNKLGTWWMNTPGAPPVLLSNGAYDTSVCLWPILINGTWNSGSWSFQRCFCFLNLTPCTQVSKANEQARSFLAQACIPPFQASVALVLTHIPHCTRKQEAASEMVDQRVWTLGLEGPKANSGRIIFISYCVSNCTNKNPPKSHIPLLHNNNVCLPQDSLWHFGIVWR